MASPLPVPHAIPPADDTALVARVRGGDVAAFATLFRVYYDPLCHFANTYVRSPERAEEIVQDVFCGVWRQRERWVVAQGVRHYLYGAVRNRAWSMRRRARLETRWLDSMRAALGHTPPACANTGEAAVEAHELEANVRRVVDELPERCREAFILSRDHHLTNAEVAALMGTTVKTVKIQLGKALRAIRRQLTDDIA